MHVVFVVDSDAFGGAEVYTHLLLRRLPAEFRRTALVSEPVARHCSSTDRCGKSWAHAPGAALSKISMRRR